MLTLLIWQTDLLWILCLFAVPERWPWAAVRDKIFTHSFLRAHSVGCRKTQAHSALNKKAVCLQQIWSSKVMQRNWVSAQAWCHCSLAVLLSGVRSEQIPRSTAAQTHQEPSSPASLPHHHLPTTAWGFHFLHDSLLNPHQIPNKHPDQLCGIILDAFPSFRICQLLAVCITEADELRASTASWDIRLYLLGYHMLEGKTCLKVWAALQTLAALFLPLKA